MTMPVIAPTGAMSSGDYCSYMVGYCNEAADALLSDLQHYFAQSTIDDWNKLWDRILDDTEAKVTVLESDVDKMKTKLTMASDAIGKL